MYIALPRAFRPMHGLQLARYGSGARKCIIDRPRTPKDRGGIHRLGRPAGLAVKPLDLHLVNLGSIPTGPTYGEMLEQPHPGDVRKSTPKSGSATGQA